MAEIENDSQASFKNESTDSEVSEMFKEMKRNEVLLKARNLVLIKLPPFYNISLVNTIKNKAKKT